MRRLFAQLYYRTRMRYWRQRAREAERLLAAERYRNIAREDYFVSATVMGTRGMVGIPPRQGPALERRRAEPVLSAVDPWHSLLTGAEHLEFDQLWWPDAQRAHVPLDQARQQFLQEVTQRRKPLSDEFGIQ